MSAQRAVDYDTRALVNHFGPREGERIGRSMRKAIAYVMAHPGCRQRDLILHIYPEANKGKSAQSGRKLVERVVMSGLVHAVAEWHSFINEGFHEPRGWIHHSMRGQDARTRRLYPLACCKVHADCITLPLEARIACARSNPSNLWPKTLHRYEEATQ